MTKRCQVVYGIYFAITFAYTAYCTYYETGPVGYVMKMELDLFGSADMEWPFMIVVFGWLLGFLASAAIVDKCVPSLVWIHRDAPATLTYPVSPISWKAVLWISAIPGLIGGAIAPAVYLYAQHDLQAQTYPIDLMSGAADPPKDAKFVNVGGVIAKRFAVSFKRVGDGSVVHELYAPITNGGWIPSHPVRYVVAVTATETADYEVIWPIELRASGVTTISGRIGGSLSTIVESSLRSKGVNLAPLYSVIHVENPNHTFSFSWDDALVFAGVGALVSVMLFGILATARWTRRRQSA